MKHYIAKPVLASTNTREADRLYNRIFDMFIKPTAELDEDGNYMFYNDYGRRVFDPNEARRIINYALAGSVYDRPSDKEIIDEVLDNAVWTVEEDYYDRKRYISMSKDPDNNPSDRAEAIIQSLGSTITKLGNLHKRAKHQYLTQGADDAEMTKLADKFGDLLKELDRIYDKYCE